MASRKTSIRNRGFTLLEVLIIIGLIVIVGAFGLIVSIDSYRSFHFHNERDTVVAVLEKARSQAINNMCFGAGCTDGKAHGVHFDHAGHYTIFQGDTYASRDEDIDETIDAKDAAATVTGTTDVVFGKLSGDVTTPGTMTVTDVNGKTSVVTIDASGRVWWTN
jgi:Tfp pilus assembly protein FimT